MRARIIIRFNIWLAALAMTVTHIVVFIAGLAYFRCVGANAVSRQSESIHHSRITHQSRSCGNSYVRACTRAPRRSAHLPTDTRRTQPLGRCVFILKPPRTSYAGPLRRSLAAASQAPCTKIAQDINHCVATMATRYWHVHVLA